MMIIRFVIGLFVVIVMSLHGKRVRHETRPAALRTHRMRRAATAENQCGVAGFA
jgi:hypothetical protein